MLNTDLMDSKDRLIAQLRIKNEKLKNCIEDFKEYDKKRKEHYAHLEQEVGALKSYIQELEETKGIPKSLQAHKDTIAQLNKYINKHRICTSYSEEELEEAKTLEAKIILKSKNKELREKIGLLSRTNKELLTKLSKYEQIN